MSDGVRNVLTRAVELVTQHATDQNESPGGSGQDDPGMKDERDDNFDIGSYNSTARTDRARRHTGLRTTGQHSSWREVAASCHVQYGYPEGRDDGGE